MARTAAKKGSWEEITPEWDDQHEEPDPITCEVRGMPGPVQSAWQQTILYQSLEAEEADDDEAGRKRAVTARQAHAQQAVDDGDGEMPEGSPSMTRMVIKECVRKITNYDDADGNPIRTGSDLANRGDAGLMTTLWFVITRKTFMGASEAKNSTEPSATSTPTAPKE